MSLENAAKRLKLFNAKKESLFRRLQTLHDMIGGLDNEEAQNLFIIATRAVDRNAFEAVLDEINSLELELNSSFDVNYEPLTAYDTMYYNVIAAVDKIHTMKNPMQPVIKPSTSSQSDPAFQSIRPQISLPALEIKPFRGDIRDWPRYRDLFTSLIINNARLTEVEKLHYLVSTLSDRPADIIKNFSLTDSNFELAWNAVKERYESDRILAAYYFEEIVKPTTVPTKPTLDSLQKFISKVHDNVTGLQNMKLPDISDFLLFSLSIRQLDIATRKEFESKHDKSSFPTYDSLINFIKSECRLLEITASLNFSATSSKSAQPQQSSKYPINNFSSKRILMTTPPDKSYKTALPNNINRSPSFNHYCIKCRQPHYLYHCPSFIALPTVERREFIKRNSLCYNCLGSHTINVCRSNRNCTICQQRHHTLLHTIATHRQTSPPLSRSNQSPATPTTSIRSPPPVVSESIFSPSFHPSPPPHSTLTTLDKPTSCTSVVLLGTACASIKNSKGRYIKFRLIIDCASTSTFITKNLVDRLGLPVQEFDQHFTGLSDTPVATTSGIVECTITPLCLSAPKLTTKALVVSNILQNLPHTDLPSHLINSFKGLHLADPEFYRSRPVDMLIGCDLFPQVLVPVSPPAGFNIGILNTIFGHVIIGPLTFSAPINERNNNFSFLTKVQPSPSAAADLNKLVQRFWEVESVHSQPILNPDDTFCEDHFLNTHRRNPDGRYVVQMPFKCDFSTLSFPQSKELALKRFYSLESRFKKNSSLKTDCVNFMKEYYLLGHMSKASNTGKNYIPYFCVYNPNSATTPTRVVFDGSAKLQCPSLNELLYPGPKLQHEVPEVLLNFRLFPYAFCCDISKMYRQILLDESQRTFTHILFREDPALPLEDYELSTVTYGLTPSSFLSHRVLIQLTRDEGQSFPLASAAILRDTVVDDILVTAESLEQLIEIKHQLCRLLDKGCFPLNKWLSNSSDFISSIKNSNTASTLVIRNEDDRSKKVLGIGWDPKTDSFFLSVEPPPLSPTYSKRQVLSAIAKIYDPLGFTAPMIFMFKCLLKDIWLSGVNWDDPIPTSLSAQWHQCVADLPSLSHLRIPRCIFTSSALSCSLLGFCDGSLKGSAAVIYFRVMFSDHSVKVFLLKSKTRVAPAKVLTIPRLELIGALLLSQTIASIQPFLSRLPLDQFSTYLFCDSTIVLSWLQKPPHLLKLFVSNRVTAILDHTTTSQWFHAPTEHNICDAASRGLSPGSLLNFKQWFEGPEWAYQPPELWPISPFNPTWSDNLPEIKPPILLTTRSTKAEPPLEIFCKFSNFNRLQRIVAFVLRFKYNAQHPLHKTSGALTCHELKLALYTCVRYDQRIQFSQDLTALSAGLPCSMKVQSLSPFLDDFGLIRVGGRLKNSNQPFSAKHPILLSNSSKLTRLIVEHFHLTYLHAGPRTLQAIISRRFWILTCRNVVRSVISKCHRCARFRSSSFSPPMGDLPSFRVVASRAFTNCSVDLAGPYTLRESLRRKAPTFKGYFALFICLAVKAVHIEVLTGLSSDSFIAALHRFVSRRGLPANVYCDQATNFRGASRQLSEIVTFLKSSNTNSVLTDSFSAMGIKFLFNVPRAPHMNGIAESNIKNTKFHLLRSIGNQILTIEEFSTVTARIEAILNSRPLCPLSNSPDEFETLTPGHFLVGGPLISVPEDNIDDMPTNRLSRWQLVSQVSRSLWRRWEREYLHTLQNKGKWFTPAQNIQEGQLVWLKEDHTPPLAYPIGRITKVHPGSDGIVRAATVRTANGVYRRPTRKIAPLPCPLT